MSLIKITVLEICGKISHFHMTRLLNMKVDKQYIVIRESVGSQSWIICIY